MWTRAQSKQVQDELKRLEVGNKKERQRFENAMEAITSVLINPLDQGYINYDLGQYRAVDVLAQYRLFFEIIDSNKVVHFVWINNDDYIHDSSKGKDDPCYKRFKNLLDRDKLEKYKHVETKKPSFTLNGKWKKSTAIYATYTDSNGKSETALRLILQATEKDYLLQDITSSKQDANLERFLLEHVTKVAKKNGVIIKYSIRLSRDPLHISFYRKLLADCGFLITAKDESEELWEL